MLSGWLLWASLAFGGVLLALSVTDFHRQLLMDYLTLPLIPAGLAVAYAVDPATLIDHAIGALAGFACLVALSWAYRQFRGREGLGLGDSKLLAGAGAWVAWPGLPSVILIAASSALTVVLLRSLAGHRVGLEERIPFGPYLCLGAWIVWLHGPLIIPL
ncbi:MAG: A24 family peptidase [Alphaproteobacteria bacterium]